MFVARQTRDGRVLPIRPSAPDRGEQYTDDLEVDVERDDVDRVEKVWLAECEDDNDDIEDDREDKVEDRDPEKSLQASRV